MTQKHHLEDFPVSPGVSIIDASVSPHVTYNEEEVTARLNAVANGLLHLNLPENSRIAIIGKNSFKYATTVGGISRARHCSVPINYKSPQDRINYCFEDSGAVLAFCDSEFAHMVPAGINKIVFDSPEYDSFLNYGPFDVPEFEPEQIVNIMYTSGTTNNPKGVLCTYASRVWSITQGSMRPNNEIQGKMPLTVISVSPYYHLAGLNDLDHPLYYSYWSNTTIIIMPIFETRKYLELITQYKVNNLRLVAPMMAMLLQEKDLLESLDLSSVYRIALTSSAAPKKMQEEVKHYFKNCFIETPYGMTETGPIFSQTHPSGIPKPTTSVGFPVKGVKLRLDESGVLQIKSPALMKGYSNRPDINSFTEDGYFITGDVFRINKYGFYFCIGRNDDMFKSGGEKIYPSEIEEIIDQHHAVALSCIVGVPDDIKGHKPYAFVVLRTGQQATEDEIKQFTIERVATYQIPRQIWIIDDLPRTLIGKIDRKALTEMATSRLQLQT